MRRLFAVLVLLSVLYGASALNVVPPVIDDVVPDADIVSAANVDGCTIWYLYEFGYTTSWGSLHAEGAVQCSTQNVGTRKFTVAICNDFRGCRGSGYYSESHQGYYYYGMADCHPQYAGSYWSWVRLRICDFSGFNCKSRTVGGRYIAGSC